MLLHDLFSFALPYLFLSFLNIVILKILEFIGKIGPFAIVDCLYSSFFQTILQESDNINRQYIYFSSTMPQKTH